MVGVGVVVAVGYEGGEYDGEGRLMARIAVEAHAKLLRLYGPRVGEVCSGCVHLRGYTYSKTYYKCTKAPVSGGAATDWRVRWQACGKYEAE